MKHDMIEVEEEEEKTLFLILVLIILLHIISLQILHHLTAFD
jgi:hypothetical protein